MSRARYRELANRLAESIRAKMARNLEGRNVEVVVDVDVNVKCEVLVDLFVSTPDGKRQCTVRVRLRDVTSENGPAADLLRLLEAGPGEDPPFMF